MKMLNNEKARLGVKKKARRRRPSARQHAISPTPFIPPSKEKSQAKVYLSKITGWIKAHKFILILLLIIFLGGFLRIYDLGAESIWLDEAESIIQADQSLSTVIETAIDTHNSPPLYFVILHFQMLLFGSGETAVRFPSAIFGILSLFFIYKIGCQLFNKKIGLISSFLLAISTFHIFYSQEARPYSLFLLMTLLSFYFFIQILKINNKWYYLGYAIANILLCYSHLFGLFVIMSQVIYFALFWKKYKQQRLKFAGVQIASVLAFIPLVILVMPRLSEIIEGGGGSIGWIPEPSFMSIIRTFTDFAGNDYLILMVFFILCLIGLISIRMLNGKWTFHFDSSGELILILLWLSFPIIIPFILSMILSPMYVNRYLIGALPAFLILIAKGTGSFPNVIVTYIIVALIALLALISLTVYYTEPMKEQWRETVDFIEYRAQTNDSFIFCAYYTQNPFDYYYEGDLEKYGIAPGETDTQKIDATVDNAIAEKERLWLVLSYTGGAITEEHLLNRFGSESVIAENEFTGVKVYLFDLHVESP